MDFKTIKEFHWLTRIIIAILVLVLALFVLHMLNIDIMAVFTPLIAIMIAGGVFLILVIYYLGKWVRIKELQVTGNSTDLERIRLETLQIRRSIDVMQKKLDNIECILEKVSD